MDRSRQHESRPESGPVIVFEPVRYRVGPGWRMLALAKAALLVWGGVSLAAVGAMALVYAQNGSIPLLQGDAQPATKPVFAATLESQPDPKPVQLAPAGPRIIAVKTAVPTKPAASPAIPAPVVKPSSAAIADARLPQARPSEPSTTGSIARLDGGADSPSRFRRLRDIRLRFPHVPGAPLRMPPPLRETDAVGRHIRQVWTAFPFDDRRPPRLEREAPPALIPR